MDPQRFGRLVGGIIVLWLVLVLLAFGTFGVIKAGQYILGSPDGPPPYGYDCDSGYRLKEANCPQDQD